VEQVARELRRRGFRLTPQRLAIVRALAMTDSHPSAETLYEELLPSFPTMSLATVYKTLNTLREMGQVMQLEFKEGSTRYDGRHPDSHAHLICSACGRIQDVEVDPFSSEARGAIQALGFQLARYRFDLYGLCQGCQQKGASATMKAAR
jgi:Fur family peroxide stress response transcriptional regulator